jgi:hypothetical protein
VSQKLYPASRFKDGHPDLALSLINMGAVLDALGEAARALPYYQKALAMYRKQTSREIASAPEARALAWLASLPHTRDAYLSAALQIPDSGPASYLPFWHDRGAVFRLLLRRHESARIARLKSKEAHEKWLQLADVRRRVARLLVDLVRYAHLKKGKLTGYRYVALSFELAVILAALPACCAARRRPQPTPP